VLESLKRGFSEKIACENLVMEINCSKLAYNVPVAELRRRLVTAILVIALEQKDQSGLEGYESVLKHFLPLMKNYFQPRDPSKSASEAEFRTMQSHCLAAIKDFALTNQRFVPAFSKTLHFLYVEYILDSALLPWCNQLEEPLKKQLQSFMKWLEAEGESSDEDSD